MPTLTAPPTTTNHLADATSPCAPLITCPRLGDPICPMTGTTTCNTTEAQQLECPDC